MTRHALIIMPYSVRVVAIALGVALFGLAFSARAAWAHEDIQLVRNCGACPISESAAFIPTSGQAGVVVRLSVSDLAATSAATYVLVSTRANPTSARCAAAQPIPGVAPFQMVVDPTRGGAAAALAFHWPSALGSGQYWFCARPQSGAGSNYASPQPFAVAAGTSPAPEAQFEFTKLLPGAGTHVTLLNWNALDPTAHFSLAPQGTPDTARIDLGDNAQQRQNPTTTVNTYANTYTYLVSIPQSMKAGTYVIVAEADCNAGGACAVHAQSVPLEVTGLTPAATPTPTGGVIGLLTSGPQGLLLAGGALFLLLVVAFLIVAPLVRRGRVREAAVASQRRAAGGYPGPYGSEDWQRSRRSASGYARYDEPGPARREYDDRGRSGRSGPSGGQNNWRHEERGDSQRGW